MVRRTAGYELAEYACVSFDFPTSASRIRPQWTHAPRDAYSRTEEGATLTRIDGCIPAETFTRTTKLHNIVRQTHAMKRQLGLSEYEANYAINNGKCWNFFHRDSGRTVSLTIEEFDGLNLRDIYALHDKLTNLLVQAEQVQLANRRPGWR